MKTGTINYPPFLEEVAEKIGNHSAHVNDERENGNPDTDRGPDTKHNYTTGVLGEMIFQHFLHSQGTEYTAQPLNFGLPVCEPDIIVGKFRMDVKTVPTYGKLMLVNKRSHNTDKGLHYYVFIKLLGNHKAQYFIYSYNAVSKWKERTFNKSTVLWQEIPQPAAQQTNQ